MKLLDFKKRSWILISLSCVTGLAIMIGLLTFLSMLLLKVPQHTVLINDLTAPALSTGRLQLYYTTPNQSHIRTYTLKDNILTLAPTPFASYTEGFLPLKERKELLEHINTQAKPLAPLNYFYNYYEDKDYKIVAPTGPLSQVYFIDQRHQVVKTPNLGNLPQPNFYLNHIARSGTVYYLSGDLVGEYKGILYTLDAISLKVLQQTTFETSQLTVYKQHSSLTTAGHVFFAMKNGLGHMQATFDTPEFISLGFTPSYILSDDMQTVALALNAATLNYALLDTQGKIIATHELPLPEEGLSPVKAALEGQFLTLLTFSPNHPFYTNYVLVYDLTTQQLLYCCALQDFSPYMALDFTIE